MKLERANYLDLVKQVKIGEYICLAHMYSKTYIYNTSRVVPKERPRTSKSGTAFTPKKTRDFENKIKEWAKTQGMKAVPFPVHVSLDIWDEHKDPQIQLLSQLGLVYSQKGDVDNLGKAVLDGLNGILYKDDKQISKLCTRRTYKPNSGFSLTVIRSGLTQQEADTLIKYIKVEEKKNERPN